jgi:hypothetical protein
MARFGAQLLANGYTILPIQPGTKKPGRHTRGKWHDYGEWNRHAARATTEVEVATWSRWPGCGIGIVGGAVAALDIDIREDAELALRIEELARQRLGDTPALRIGKAPKRMLVYRTAEPFQGIKRHPLEVLCLGQQFLAYADHPDTGAPYAWPEEGLADLDISQLPEIGEAADVVVRAHAALVPGGIPAAQRRSIGRKILIRAAVQQLARIFGPEAETPCATLLKDWAEDERTASSADIIATGHPSPSGVEWVTGPWAGRLLLAGSETSDTDPGYLNGAVEASARSVEACCRRHSS